MAKRVGQERPHVTLLHQLSERLTAAENFLTGIEHRAATEARHINPRSPEILERSLEQLEQACEIVVHLQKALDGPRPSITVRAAATALPSLEAVARGILTAAKTQAASSDAHAIHVECRSGDCTEGIIDTAREIGAAAIFVGRRGRGRLSGLLLGSVSQKLASLPQAWS